MTRMSLKTFCTRMRRDRAKSYPKAGYAWTVEAYVRSYCRDNNLVY